MGLATHCNKGYNSYKKIFARLFKEMQKRVSVLKSSSPEGPRKVPARWLCTCGDLAGTLAGTLQGPCTDPHRICGNLAQILTGIAQGSKLAGTLHRPSQILGKYLVYHGQKI
ncbi:hypothetical protein K435DRAFT_800962 [Dendrothele bispora CBS 962.96]|uniref:Uncharacterized protein n=1 Tax=Dendrothele bispora (strain CBS 962.96) TaxID=1314807 RepID=A0A4S8LRD5_DENBC|nr:hypothetical protein K435DRAFT_800962 [Dendrothele bispora CBS 962.96]